MPACYSIRDGIEQGINVSCSEIIDAPEGTLLAADVEAEAIVLPYGEQVEQPLFFVTPCDQYDVHTESVVSVDLSKWRVSNHLDTDLLEPRSPAGFALFHVRGMLELASRSRGTSYVLVLGGECEAKEKASRGNSLREALKSFV